jgi:vitamin B12/bleomycin/antimicrobial peptide transport system ATP-binding/permease protein
LPARRPDWLFLDEATASLDLESEAHLYRIIKERLPRATIVSIAHRQSVAEFHDHKLVLQREGDRPQRLFSQTVRAAAAE